jgi:hypothetical protein
MQDRFADRLARNRAGVDGRPADHFQLFNEGGPFSKFRRLNRGALSAWPRPDNDEIVLFHGSPREYITVTIVEDVDARLALCHHSENLFLVVYMKKLGR